MHLITKQGNRITIQSVQSFSKHEYLKHLFTQTPRHFRELWAYRELTQNLVRRDLKVRYKNSVLGILWSLLNPLLMMLVFTAVFTIMRAQPIAKYPAFVLVGLLPWQFFADAVGGATASIVGNGHLLNKVYFPREILVISGVLSNLINFLLALLVLIPILLIFDIPFTWWILQIPLIIIIQVIFTLGVGFIVATANVFYRDVGMLVSITLLAGFFLTPVFYPLEGVPQSYMLFGIDWNIWRLTWYFNPMASLIEGYRRILYYGQQHDLFFLFRTFFTAIAFLIFGMFIFYRYNHRFGEVV